MADKTWIAKDIKMMTVSLSRNISAETGQDVLTIIREYYFTNTGGEGIGALVPQRLVRELPWVSLSQEMKDVFIKLDSYTRSEALKEQGM